MKQKLREAMQKKQSNTSNGKSLINLDCDEVLHEIGGTGLWQLVNFLILCFPSMASGFLVLTFVFTGNNIYANYLYSYAFFCANFSQAECLTMQPFKSSRTLRDRSHEKTHENFSIQVQTS